MRAVIPPPVSASRAATSRVSRSFGCPFGSPKEVRDEVVTIFTAGHETTAQALTWSWYLLSHHPSVEAKLYEEAVDPTRWCSPTPKTLQINRHFARKRQITSMKTFDLID
jgi:hypothetical protein